MTTTKATARQAYAELLLRGGVNLQPGESVLIRGELGHREFVRLLVATAYDMGARFVLVDWSDPLSSRARYQHIERQYLGHVPEYEVTRRKEFVDDRWKLVSLTGTEYPDAYEDIDPTVLMEDRKGFVAKLKFFMQATMNNQVAWTVAAVPVVPWAKRVFPELSDDDALERLWELVLRTCRADHPDPLEAWTKHDQALKKVSAFMDRHAVRAVRYLDETPGFDGKAATDLTVGLTDRPYWSGGSSVNSQGHVFFANIPTEEIFSTPHNQRTEGWVRTTKPGFIFEREVSGAYFRFERGEVVEWRAEKGQEVLDQVFEMRGARRLGEVSLVDVRSPINQSGVIFYDTLFDENAVCHIAFGNAYPEGVQGGSTMSEEELEAMGVNSADTHQDLMIGAGAMKVIGICADGREVLIMNDGMFVDDVVA
jgi:aminopeptidase